MKKIFKIVSLILAVTMLLTACSMKKNSDVGEDSIDQDAVSKLDAVDATDSANSIDDEIVSDLSTDSATVIKLNGTSFSVSGDGAEASGSTLKISASGKYILSGTMTNGNIIVDDDSKGKVYLVFNGVNMTCSTTSPFYVKDCGKAIITLIAGTTNSLTDTSNYKYDTADENEPNATLFCKDDLTINGTGPLTIDANYKNGISCKDNLVIAGGTISIDSVEDGIIGRDTTTLGNTSITIKSGVDGIKSTNDEDTTKGSITIVNGTYNITSGNDGIQAETTMLIKGGTFNITANGGASNSAGHTDDMMNRGGPFGSSSTATDDTESYKGIKAASTMEITGGTFTVNSADDSIHSNGTIKISGGTFTINSGDDGIHADATLTISDGDINIKESYEGIESANIVINGGTTSVVASDDGTNANGTSGTTTITGGSLYIDADGDGLDSNGSVSMSGGTVLINGPTNDGNGAVDYDSSFNITGGTLIAAGSSGMAQAPSSESTQYSLEIGTSQSANTIIAVKDSSGNTIVAFAPSKQYSNVVISTPDIKKGETYTVYTGATCAGTSTYGLYSGTATGGTSLGTGTISSYLTTIGSVSSMGGFGGGVGGGKPNMR